MIDYDRFMNEVSVEDRGRGSCWLVSEIIEAGHYGLLSVGDEARQALT